MKKKILAFTIITLAYLFPFRIAFMSENNEGMWTMFNFLLVVIGVIVFLYLSMSPDSHEQG